MSKAFIAAELLKHTTEWLGEELVNNGRKVEWPKIARKVFINELRANPAKNKGKLKADAGLVWNWLKQQGLTTREVYQLLLCWILTDKIEAVTQDYYAILEELNVSIERGFEGEVEDIPAEEIQKEWEAMRTGYYATLHLMVEKLIQ